MRDLKAFVIAILTFLPLMSLAVRENYSIRTGHGNLVNGSVLEIQDGKFEELLVNPPFTDVSTKARVILGVEEYAGMLYSNAYTYTPVLKVTLFNDNGTVQSTFNIKPTVKYSPQEDLSYVDLVVNEYNGIHKIKVEVISENIPAPKNTFLEVIIENERHYPLPAGTTIIPEHRFVSFNDAGVESKGGTGEAIVDPLTSDEVEIIWDYVQGAEEYDLEWTWVDNYDNGGVANIRAASNIPFSENDFRRNSTRVRVKDQHYRIPLLYSKGYFIYRVRPVGRFSSDLSREFFGKWSVIGDQGSTVASWAQRFQIKNDHQNKKNWQFQATYAEEGKKKEVVSYFDGTLRSRQTVTRLNSKNQSVVGENIYDNQGRAAVQVLPAPVKNPAIRYYPKFNLNPTGEPYTHYDFDWQSQQATCENNVTALKNTSGAGKYYSTNNTAEGNWQDNVPDAEGFPFSQTEFTPDNTGRIRRQSGVGPTHKLGSGHETQYFYLQPAQEELNRLFGYRVGYKGRYKKNMVVDANGQVSVSYLDPAGRVLATALAGASPNNLVALEDEQDDSQHGVIITDLLAKVPQYNSSGTITVTAENNTDSPNDDNELYATGTFGDQNDGLELNTQVGIVNNNSNIELKYSLKTGSYTDPCLTSQNKCYPFVYDLYVSMKDDCGNEVLSDSINETVGGAHVNYQNCTDYNNAWTLNNANPLAVGSYSISKKLKVNEAKLNEYVEDYLQNNCLYKSVDFKVNVDVECFSTCQECLDSLGTLNKFIELNGEDPATLQSQNQNLYNKIQTEYNKLKEMCEAPCKERTSCDSYRGMLLSDFRPGGQYASITDLTDVLNVFNDNTVLSHHIDADANPNSWRHPLTQYVDEYGTPSKIVVTQNADGTTQPATVQGITLEPTGVPGVFKVLPQQLANVSDFISQWQNSWAESLVGYHPESCYLNFYDVLCDQVQTIGNKSVSSDMLDNALLQQMQTWIPVQNPSGNNNMFGVNFMPASEVGTGGNAHGGVTLWNNDPFKQVNLTNVSGTNITIMFGGNELRDWLMNYMLTNTYKTMGGVNYTMWSWAVKTVIDGTSFGGGSVTSNAVAVTAFNNASAAQKDLVWNTFKSYYVSEKKKVIQLYADNYAKKNGCYNVCIGSDPTPLDWIADIFADNSSLVQQLINLLNALNPNNLCSLPNAYPYAEKERRIIPIDNLYNSEASEEEAINELSDQADLHTYQQTGACPLKFDMELFLKSLGTNGHFATLKAGNTVSSNDVPALTMDLLSALGGNTNQSANAVNISGPVSGNTMTIGFAQSGASLCNITFTIPGYLWSTYGNWQIVDISQLYYVSSPTPDSYTFKALVKISTGGQLVEVVADGKSCAAVGGCGMTDNPNLTGETVFNSLADCKADDKWTGSIAGLLNSLKQEGELNNTNVNLGGNDAEDLYYKNSYLPVWLEDGAHSAVYNGGTTWNITTGNKRLEIVMSSAFPANMHQVSTVSLDGNTLAIKVLKTDGNYVTINATINYMAWPSKDPISLAFDCDCEEEQNIEDLYMALWNHLLNRHQNNNPWNPFYQPQELLNLTPHINVSGVSIHGWTVTAPHIKFYFQKGGCLQTLSGVGVDNVDYITNLEINEFGTVFTAIGYDISENKTIPVNGRLGCIKAKPCEDCIPQTVEPVSCNQAWDAYTHATNGVTGKVPDFTLPAYFTEEWFCKYNYAYLTSGYLYYLTKMSVNSVNHEHYITIAEFGNTVLGAGFNNYNVAIDAFHAYSGDLAWGNYVNQVWFPAQTGVCPPAPIHFELQLPPVQYPCDQFELHVAAVAQKTQYEMYLENVAQAFRKAYIEAALANAVENFTRKVADKEYQYTLYYYDQAGNLTQTVPPQGVDRMENPDHTQISLARQQNNSPAGATVKPEHTYRTLYKYNSLNQLVWQRTPDGGISRFAYDQLGRLVVSQNAKQKAAGQFSYTKYDGLGRIVEVGEMNATGYQINALGKLETTGGVAVNVGATNSDGSTIFPDNISTNREEVVKTIYDKVLNTAIKNMFEAYSEDNTRNRITSVLYYDNYDLPVNVTSYNNATHYDYDEHGNVKELVQEIKDQDLVALNQHIKKMYYEYDLVSGKVNKVTFQKGQPDQFIHRYDYDSDNRITNVFTSKDGKIWEQDAKYFYYDHGPLARTELGDKKVQGTDYAYTIQGWIKGNNSDNLSAKDEMGKDGFEAGLNQYGARDASGYALHYFDNDYKSRISVAQSFLKYSESTAFSNNPKNLYNGNIKQMLTAIVDHEETITPTYNYQYSYDQLNRIDSMHSQKLTTSGGNVIASTGYFRTKYKYDRNGNLQNLYRAVEENNQLKEIDKFQYHYAKVQDTDFSNDYKLSNRLAIIADSVDSTASTTDIDNQLSVLLGTFHPENTATHNYIYDEIGQLIQDKTEKIEEIQWKVNNKVKSITRSAGSDKDNLEFAYDAVGNRIMKVINPNNGGQQSKTFYFRDAQGNPMAIYQLKREQVDNVWVKKFYVQERNIYGSSRVGQEKLGEVVASANSQLVNINTNQNRRVGDKAFELSNHLGNVLVTITDRKLPELGQNSTIAYMNSDVQNSNDYLPFGMGIRKNGDSYRYGFNGMESDDEVKGEDNSYTTLFRQYDPRVGRWLSIDPKVTAFESPYLSMGGNPIMYNDVLGDTIKWANDPATLDLQYQVMALRAQSNSFDIIMRQLEAHPTVFEVRVDEEYLNKRGGTATKGMFRTNGEGVNEFLLRTLNENHTIVEEFFHAFQSTVYDLKDGERKVNEIEAEANLMEIFVQGILKENVLSSPDASLELTDSKFYDALRQNNLLVTEGSEVFNMYKEYLELQEKSTEGGIDAYSGEQRPLVPEAFNEIMSKTVVSEVEPPSTGYEIIGKKKK